MALEVKCDRCDYGFTAESCNELLVEGFPHGVAKDRLIYQADCPACGFGTVLAAEKVQEAGLEINA